jgi:hypothetical protein
LKDCLFFEFKLSKNLTRSDAFDLNSPNKTIRNNVCSIGLSHAANDDHFILSLNLDNVDRIKKIKAKITYLDFPHDFARKNEVVEYRAPFATHKKNKYFTNVALSLVLKDKNIEKDENNVENYVARFIVNFELTY